MQQQPPTTQPIPKANNYAFIDSQNVNLGVRSLDWRLSWKRFRQYLARRYDVTTAYLFLGFVPENQDLYRSLQKAGYVLIFKEVTYRQDGKPKGNVDAELVLQAMIDYPQYDQAVIVTSTGISPVSCATSGNTASCASSLVRSANIAQPC